MAKVLHTQGMSRCIGCYTCMMVCAGVNRHDHSVGKSAIKIKTSGGMEGKFVTNVCVGCRDERPCLEHCPTGALTPREGGGVILHNDLCISCKRCAEGCPVNAVFFDQSEFLPIVCRQCGMCAVYCPHECLQMEEVTDADKQPGQQGKASWMGKGAEAAGETLFEAGTARMPGANSEKREKGSRTNA